MQVKDLRQAVANRIAKGNIVVMAGTALVGFSVVLILLTVSVRPTLTSIAAHGRRSLGECKAAVWNRGYVREDLALTDKNLAEVLRSKATAQKDVILQTFTMIEPWHIAFMQNSLWQMTTWNLLNHTISVCSTHQTCCNAWGAGMPVYSNELKGAQDDKPVNLKWLLAHKFLSLGYNVLFLDWDLGFRQSPFHIFDRSHDLQMLLDALERPRMGEFSCPVGYGVTINPCASTGVWLALANEITVALTYQVYNISRTGPWEQAVFNEVAPLYMYEFGGVSRALTLKLLPKELAANQPNIERLIADKWISSGKDIRLVHCGGVHGPNDKKDCLADQDLWHPELYKPVDVVLKAWHHFVG